jgi:hypothetical protein
MHQQNIKFLIHLMPGCLSSIIFGANIPTVIDGVYCASLGIPNFQTATYEGKPASLGIDGVLREYDGIRHIDVGHELVHTSKYLDAHNFLAFIFFLNHRIDMRECGALLRNDNVDMWKTAVRDICTYYKINPLPFIQAEKAYVLQNTFQRIFDAVRVYKWIGINTLESMGDDSDYAQFLKMWNLFWGDSGDSEAEFLCIVGDGSGFDFNENRLLREIVGLENLQRWSHRAFESTQTLLTSGTVDEMSMAREVVELGRCLIYERRISGFLQGIIRATAPKVQGFRLGDVIGDGNCLQRTLAVILRGNQNVHDLMRDQLFEAAMRAIENPIGDNGLQHALHNIPADQYARHGFFNSALLT